MMKQSVVLVDYQMGNLFSIEKQIRKLGHDVLTTSDTSEIIKATKLILPGVGHFSKAMENLTAKNLIEPLNEVVLNKKVPILGICLGMQLMARFSEEGNAQGLGWIDGTVKKFQLENTVINKIPHTGWDDVFQEKQSVLMNTIISPASFYFVHSYFFQCNDKQDILTTSEHENKFVSAIQKNNIFGVQFHPEKSHEVGLQLLKNFIEHT